MFGYGARMRALRLPWCFHCVVRLSLLAGLGLRLTFDDVVGTEVGRWKVEILAGNHVKSISHQRHQTPGPGDATLWKSCTSLQILCPKSIGCVKYWKAFIITYFII